MRKFDLEYIEIKNVHDVIVVFLHLHQCMFVPYFPITDHGKTLDMMRDIFGLVSCQTDGNIECFFYPKESAFVLIANGNRMRLPFSSTYVNKQSSLYYILKSYAKDKR